MINSNVNQIPTPVDYTSRDFYALREDLISRVKYNIPSWQGTDSSDFGVALIEAFAYLGDITNYYIDRMANESYLPTATQRQNVLNIASLYGYIPTGLGAASITLSFGNSSASSITIPAGAQVYTSITNNDAVIKLVYTTDSQVVIPAGTLASSLSVTSTASHAALLNTASTYGNKLATSTASPNQRYALTDNTVVDNAIKVYTSNDSGATGSPWTRVTRLSEYNSTDPVFTVAYDADNYPYIIFGDGISGSIPLGDIYVQYSTGGGIVGNISTNQFYNSYGVFQYVASPATLSNVNSYVSVTNSSSGVGGTDIESSDSIRSNAPLTVRSNQRVVSLKDYDRFATSILGVGKGHAVGVSASVVSLFIAPYRDVYGVEAFPGRKSIAIGAYTASSSTAGTVTSIAITSATGVPQPGQPISGTNISSGTQVVTVTNTGSGAYTLTLTKATLGNLSGTYTLAAFTLFNGTTSEMDSLVSTVSNLLSTKTQIGTTVSVNPPTYIPIAIKLNFSSISGYSDVTVKANITSALQTYFSYANRDFNQTIAVEDISKLLLQVEGVKTVAVQDLYKVSAGATATLPVAAGTSISSGDSGIFTLDTTNNLSIGIPGSIIIGGLTTTTAYATLDQAYSPTVFNYSITNYVGYTVSINVAAALIDGVTASGATLVLDPGSSQTYGVGFALPGTSSAGTKTFKLLVANSTASVTATYYITVYTTSAA